LGLDEKSDASAKVGMKGDDSIVASALKKKRNKKLTAEIKALNTNIKEDFADLINWEQKYQYAPGTIESPDWVSCKKKIYMYSFFTKMVEFIKWLQCGINILNIRLNKVFFFCRYLPTSSAKFTAATGVRNFPGT